MDRHQQKIQMAMLHICLRSNQSLDSAVCLQGCINRWQNYVISQREVGGFRRDLVSRFGEMFERVSWPEQKVEAMHGMKQINAHVSFTKLNHNLLQVL